MSKEITLGLQHLALDLKESCQPVTNYYLRYLSG